MPYQLIKHEVNEDTRDLDDFLNYLVDSYARARTMQNLRVMIHSQGNEPSGYRQRWCMYHILFWITTPLRHEEIQKAKFK